MGGSPVLWCEVADFLAFHSALSHREAERYVEVLRAHDYCSAQDALQQIPVWHAQGVTPELLSVGDSRPFEIGWIRNDAALPGLLRAIADEIEREQHTTMPTRARWYVWHSHDGREQHVHSTAMDPPAEHADVHVVCCSAFAASSGERHDPLCDQRRQPV